MICKWCGEKLASSDTNCKRCGKEIPALSDCGGFYDLVPQAKRAIEVSPVMTLASARPIEACGKIAPAPRESFDSVPPAKAVPAPPAAASVPPVVPSPKTVPPHKKAPRKKRRSLLVFAVTSLAFVLLMMLLVLAAGKVTQYSKEIGRLQKNLQTATEKITALQSEAEPDNPEPETTAPTVAPVPVLAEQDVVFSVENSTKEMKAALNLGDYNDVAMITYGLDESTGAVNSVGYSLKEANTTVTLTIDRSSESGTRAVFVSYSIDEAVYGLTNQPDTIKWQYRFDAESDWEDLPEDVFIQAHDADKIGLSIPDDAFLSLTEDHNGRIELRCEISRTNADKGSMTIIMDGIRFHDEATIQDHSVG